jgi:hypothetical protein
MVVAAQIYEDEIFAHLAAQRMDQGSGVLDMLRTKGPKNQ